MENEVVYEFSRNQDETVLCSLREYKSRAYIDLRIFFKPKNSEQLCPTKKGITLPTELLPELKKALAVYEKKLHQTASK